MRIDSSGNLLVGTTDAAPYDNNAGNTADNGIVLSEAGFLSAARYQGGLAFLNRTGNDGELVNFRKDGAIVGSIGSLSNHLYVGNGDTGLRFINSLDAICPANVSTPTGSDALLDLGRTAERFKDLYLSGGAYLGGTVAANKLDDYEEGTWTPAFTNLTIGNGVVAGRYTKIGRTVSLEVIVTWGSTTSASGSWHVNNIPFVSAATHRAYGTGNILDNGTANHTNLSVITESQSNLYFSATYITGTYTRYTSITDTIPMTWTTGDFIKTNIVYTAA
jgi:hypothetical protein